jgi:SET domain-containing protein
MGRQDEARELNARAKRILRGLDVRAGKDVVATATVNPQFACFAMSVRPSRIHRWGVFAGERIPAEREVIEYTGERILIREAKRRPRSRHYLFSLDKQWMLDGAVGGSGAELINHSCEPNLYARLIKGRIFYFSKREIEAGEELTVDYAFAPDLRPQPCLCGSPLCRGTINVKPKQKR